LAFEQRGKVADIFMPVKQMFLIKSYELVSDNCLQWNSGHFSK